METITPESVSGPIFFFYRSGSGSRCHILNGSFQTRLRIIIIVFFPHFLLPAVLGLFPGPSWDWSYGSRSLSPSWRWPLACSWTWRSRSRSWRCRCTRRRPPRSSSTCPWRRSRTDTRCWYGSLDRQSISQSINQGNSRFQDFYQMHSQKNINKHFKSTCFKH